MLALSLALISGASFSSHSDAGEPGDQTRETMSGIFDSMLRVFPLSLNDGRFSDPALRDTTLAALQDLAASGSQLENHGQQHDRGFSFLSQSLARDTRDIHDRFAEGRVGEARFLFHELIQTCVACHSRLPSSQESSLADRFVKVTDVSTLPLEERARFEVAIRQFDRAADTYRELLESKVTSPGYLDTAGYLDDYLELSIRVREDYAQPISVFERFAARDDVSDYLRNDLRRWIRSLREVPKIAAKGSNLERARELVTRAEDKARFPNERQALAHYFAASGLLHRCVSKRPVTDPDTAEAYYLLGVIESRVGRSFWISQTESFMEASIRLAPTGPFAAPAYAVLEEFIISGYTGSAGTNVPREENELLRELAELIDRSQENR